MDGDLCTLRRCQNVGCVEEKALDDEDRRNPYDFFLESCYCENCLTDCDPTHPWCHHHEAYQEACQ
jgi:hypothetical protein